MLPRAPGHARPRRRGLVVTLALLASAVAPVVAAGPAAAAPQDDIDAKREEARRLEAQIETNGERLSILTEDYNEARLKIDQTAAEIADAEAREEAARAESDEVRRLVQGRAAELYKKAGSVGAIPLLGADNFRDAGKRAKYTAAAAARDDDLLARLVVVRERLDERQAELAVVKAQAEAEQTRLAEQQAAVEAAQAEQQGLLSQVEGELAELVRQEQERRQREAEQRAREELARRLEQEQAARAAAAAAAAAAAGASGSGSGNGSGSGGSTPVAPAPQVPAPNPRAQVAVDTALAQLGKPYRYGAAGPDTFDCSGLTMYAWAAAGVSIPHSSRAQYAAIAHIPMDALTPGDLVYYGSPIHHAGMFIGNGQYVHAPQTGDVVKISSIYRSDFAGAGRPG